MTKDERIINTINYLKSFVKSCNFKYYDYPEKNHIFDNFNGNDLKSIASCNYDLHAIFVTEDISDLHTLYLILHECGHMIEYLTCLNNGKLKRPFSKNYRKRELRAGIIGNYLRSLLNIDDIISEKLWNEHQRAIREKGYLMKY